MCGAQHGADDAIVRAASAEIAVERCFHLVTGRRRVLPQQRRRAHQDTGDTIAALHGLLGDEGPLQWMRPSGTSQSLKRQDVLPRDRPQRRIAGVDGTIADDDVAGAALAGATSEMRTGETDFAAQDIQQRAVGIGVDGRIDAIQAETNLRHEEAYCALSGSFLTTSAHLTMSPRRNFSNSSGLIDIASAP